MNCMICGTYVGTARTCPKCGTDLTVQKKALFLSNAYYNQGLDKAQIRDLSGAIDLLTRSLKYNKFNIQARNLLGLVYFETGEAVAALSEWVLSKNIKAENNIASDYIARLQAEPAKLDAINQSIKKYNVALQACRDGHDDIAVVQLKKILSQNPRLIKAYHLLGLNYINRKEYEKARKTLKKAARIDKTNATTLRFLKEIDEQTGTVTKIEGRDKWYLKKSDAVERGREQEILIANGDTVISPAAFRETSAFATMLTLIFGIAIGALLVAFIAIPAIKQNINRKADEKIVAYSTTVAAKESQIEQMSTQIDSTNMTVASANEQIAEANKKADNYENLMKSFSAFQEGNYDQALKMYEQVDATNLSTDARVLYDTISSGLTSQMFDIYYKQGMEAFEKGDYTAAVDAFTKALTINPDDYNAMSYRAHSLRLSGNVKDAITAFQAIIDKNPNTRRSQTAQYYIDLLNSGELGDKPQDAAADQDAQVQNADASEEENTTSEE